MDRKAVLPVLALLSVLSAGSALRAESGEGDPYLLGLMGTFNGTLRAEWMDLRAEQIDVLTVGGARATSRLHRRSFRWVAEDWRRAADGDRLTWLVDRSDARPSRGPGTPAAEAAIACAIATWQAAPCVQRVEIVHRADGGDDPDIFDAAIGFGGLGNWRAADVVLAGWLPQEFFDAVVPPDGGRSVLAVSVTFIFVGADGEPTDMDGDGYLDTAANEIYFNDAFSWSAADAALSPGSGIDLQTVALHELGHALGMGHAGPPPEAVMNPVYSGVRREPRTIDHAAACTVWESWPR